MILLWCSAYSILNSYLIHLCVYVRLCCISISIHTHAQRFLGRHWTSLWAYSCFTSKHIWMCISSSTHTYVCIYIYKLYLHILLVRTFQTLNLAEHFQGVHVRPHAIVCPCHELVSIYSSSSSSSPGAPSMCHGARVQIPFSVLNNCTSYGQTTVCVCVRVLLLIRLPENKHVAMYIHIQCMYAWLCLFVCLFLLLCHCRAPGSQIGMLAPQPDGLWMINGKIHGKSI